VKKIVLAVFCMLAVCSLLLANVVKAAEPGYERIDYNPGASITIDGEWTTADEWTLNGENTTIGTDATIKSVWTMVSTTPTFIINDTWLAEFFTDTTDDAGDYWEMCFDGDQSGGAAPQVGDYKIEIMGHTNLTVYSGDGSAWVENASFPVGNLTWANTLSASPVNATPHWILELLFFKGDLELGIQWNFRLAMYDENTTTLAAWPPTSADVPDEWGVQNYLSGAVPEAFSIAVVVLLSTAAMIVGFYFLRKKAKTDSFNLAKARNNNYVC
jgi:hypothetical protein